MHNKKIKRLRIFAGPNGSGKSELAKYLKDSSNSNIKLGVFVNADIIEYILSNEGSVKLSDFNITSKTKSIQKFIIENGISPIKLKNKGIHKNFSIRNNKISYSGEINSYIAADIASFIRENLLHNSQSFSFETVFSHKSKLEIMKKAKLLGYKVYLYFITTEDPEININRIKVRVEKGGHNVNNEVVKARYFRSLDLLLDAIKIADRAFLFDNSGKYNELVAEVTNGKEIYITDFDKEIPNWFIEFIYNKKT